MTDAPIIAGLKIKLERATERERPCKRCGSHDVVIGKDSVMFCIDCDHPRGRLPEKLADFFEELVRLFGRPREVIKIKTKTSNGYWARIANGETIDTGSAQNAAPCADPAYCDDCARSKNLLAIGLQHYGVCAYCGIRRACWALI